MTILGILPQPPGLFISEPRSSGPLPGQQFWGFLKPCCTTRYGDSSHSLPDIATGLETLNPIVRSRVSIGALIIHHYLYYFGASFL